MQLTGSVPLTTTEHVSAVAFPGKPLGSTFNSKSAQSTAKPKRDAINCFRAHAAARSSLQLLTLSCPAAVRAIKFVAYVR